MTALVRELPLAIATESAVLQRGILACGSAWALRAWHPVLTAV